jgi:hypothetical protein
MILLFKYNNTVPFFVMVSGDSRNWSSDFVVARSSRMLESIHGGNNRKHEGITPLDQQDQLFAKAIRFPMDESDAWTEKV